LLRVSSLTTPTLRCDPPWSTPPVGGGAQISAIKDFSDQTRGICLDLNPLEDDPGDLAAGGAPVVVTWSGWFGGDEVGVGTWGPRGWAALQAWCDCQGPAFAAAGRELWLRPHAGHVLSDAQRCLTFLRGREGQAIGLLLDPVSMLAPSMLADAAEHLDRMLGALAQVAGVRAVLAPGARGLPIPEGVLGAALREHWPASKPVVVSGAERAG
jgi:hypothetical protein